MIVDFNSKVFKALISEADRQGVAAQKVIIQAVEHYLGLKPKTSSINTERANSLKNKLIK